MKSNLITKFASFRMRKSLALLQAESEFKCDKKMVEEKK